MDREAFVELLNEDLKTEFRSIVQYVQHVATLKGAEYLSVIDELRAHISQEIQHAQILAEQVDFLGGVPTTDVPDVPSVPGGKEALSLDLALEQEQLQRYRDRFAQANELGLADVAEAIRPLLEQTQEHVRDLQTVLGV
jgi:bacterioferritin